MKSRHRILGVGVVALSALLPGLAQAKLDACGGVFLSGDAKCQFVRDKECQTHCETTSVETACVASLQTSCESECTASSTTECTETCTPSCSEQCTTVEKQSSQALCRSECAQDCSAKCDGQGGHCEACCQQNCNVRCEDHCSANDTEEVCETKCSPVCEDSCVAKASSQCQIECQTTQFESCQTTTVQTCETDCQDKGGAIFCDGQFLNVTSLKDCAAQLAAELDIDVDVSLDVDVDVDSDADVTVTHGGKKHEAKCSVAAPGASGSGSVLGGLVLASALGAFLRRRR